MQCLAYTSQIIYLLSGYECFAELANATSYRYKILCLCRTTELARHTLHQNGLAGWSPSCAYSYSFPLEFSSPVFVDVFSILFLLCCLGGKEPLPKGTQRLLPLLATNQQLSVFTPKHLIMPKHCSSVHYICSLLHCYAIHVSLFWYKHTYVCVCEPIQNNSQDLLLPSCGASDQADL